MFFGRRRPEPEAGADSDSFTSEALALLDSLYGTALRLTRDADRAQDLVQDTYLKAFRARDRFATGTNLKAWLFTILHNTWRNRRRDQARSRVEFDSEAVEQAHESAQRALHATSGESGNAAVARELRRGAQGRARCAARRRFAPPSGCGTSRSCRIRRSRRCWRFPIGTVMSRISRGRRQLHDLLVRARLGAGVG